MVTWLSCPALRTSRMHVGQISEGRIGGRILKTHIGKKLVDDLLRKRRESLDALAWVEDPNSSNPRGTALLYLLCHNKNCVFCIATYLITSNCCYTETSPINCWVSISILCFLFIFHSLESMSGEYCLNVQFSQIRFQTLKSIDIDPTLNVGHLQFEMWVSCVTVQEMLAK